MNYVYIALCSDNTLYTGWTTDVKRREKTHNLGKGAKYTKSRLPIKIVYIEEFEIKQEALKREYTIKRLSKKQKEELILNYRREIYLRANKDATASLKVMLDDE